MFLYRETRSTINGYNKVAVIARSSHHSIKNWDDRDCNYYRIKLKSSKSGVHQEKIFEEPNDLIFEFNNQFIYIRSSDMTYHVSFQPKKTLYFADLKERFHFFQINDARLIKKYYLSERYQSEGNKSSCIFSEFNIQVNDQFYLIASFINNKLDLSKKIFLTDQNTEYRNKICFIACILTFPGIVLLMVIILLMVNSSL